MHPSRPARVRVPSAAPGNLRSNSNWPEAPPVWLSRKRRPELLFVSFGVLLQPADIGCERLLERFSFLEIPCSRGLGDLPFQKQFALGNAGFQRRFNLRDLRLS